MNCPRCGKDNPYGTAICGHCGFSIADHKKKQEQYYHLGEEFRKENKYLAAIEAYTTAARLGSSVSLLRLGDIYYQGSGVDVNYQEAAKYYILALKQGHSYANGRLAKMYQYGHGFEQDYYKAIALYKKSIEWMDTSAAENLGILYETAPDGLRSYNLAIMCYEKAVQMNSENGTIYGKLGHAYGKGIGRPINFEKAFQFYNKAIELGCNDGEVYFNLAELYREGKGGSQNEYFAKDYYKKAVGLGYKQAEAALEALLQKMQRDREESKAALARLQAMVAENEARMPSVEEERRNRLTRNCPRCGHKSGHPINEFEKKASIGFWGFASSKWGKSYKCDACGYMW